MQDSEIVISIYNPFRDKLNTYRGYDIKTLGQAFRIVSVLKSRYGDSDVEIGCNFFGACNWWAELPLPDAIYDYQRYSTIDYLISDNNDIQDANEQNENFNFTL